jgi:two-component system, NarL family, invasion response regulator UvrY
MTSILIADDHTVLREGLKQILTAELPGARFGEAGTTGETLVRLRDGSWSAVLLDIFMPGRGGLEVLREVRHGYPALPVLVLSSAPEEQLALRVLRAGAAGYLNKQTAPEELTRALRKVLAGGKYISSTLAERLAAELSRGEPSPLDQLSHREFQVMQMLVSGKMIKEIAAELGVSVKTVSTFHTRIWEKLRLKNDVELVHFALDHDLIPRKA